MRRKKYAHPGCKILWGVHFFLGCANILAEISEEEQRGKALKVIYAKVQARSKRSAFITLFQADTKSCKNLT